MAALEGGRNPDFRRPACRWPLGADRMALVMASKDPGPSSVWSDLRDALTQPDPETTGPLTFCASGPVVRALLGVHVPMALALCWVAPGPAVWGQWLAEGATLAVPACLAWLLCMCVLLAQWAPMARAAPMVQGAAAATSAAAITALVWWPLHRAGLAPGDTGALPPTLCGAAWGWALWQVERWRQRARMPAAAAARLADLQTRIRPHFLFNTLNSAITLVQLDPDRAEELLQNLSDLFRAGLGQLDQPTTVAAEVTLSQRYLAIEQLRFGSRLEVDWDLDPAAAHAILPILALQPLVENAVRHGVEPSDKGGRIEVRTRRRRDRVLISVTNSVPEGPTRHGHGIGLASVRQRLRLLHDLDADFRSGLIEDGRWRVSIGVPA
ncbi:MAG: sensor histidine kinase [Burkholderiales bacterium PBB6]|nr:MAG: sensor histidine kinase [Burkholderiales bacterium PBB6]